MLFQSASCIEAGIPRHANCDGSAELCETIHVLAAQQALQTAAHLLC